MRTLVTAAVVLGLDLWTKWLIQKTLVLYQSIPVIPGFFSLTYVLNPGAAFGLLPGQRWLFYTVTALAVGIILYYARRPEGREGVLPYALGLMLGGALGNLVDRIRYGEVVDFLLFYYKDWQWPAFNVADSAIVCGGGLLVLQTFLSRGRPAVSHE